LAARASAAFLLAAVSWAVANCKARAVFPEAYLASAAYFWLA